MASWKLAPFAVGGAPVAAATCTSVHVCSDHIARGQSRERPSPDPATPHGIIAAAEALHVADAVETGEFILIRSATNSRDSLVVSPVGE